MRNAIVTACLLLFSPVFAVAITNDTVSAASSTNAVNPADWGPAYQPGMERGPASVEQSMAAGLAEEFMTIQKFAGKYAKRACAVGGESMDVEFALLSDRTGQTHGVVRVNMENGDCTWMGDRK